MLGFSRCVAEGKPAVRVRCGKNYLGKDLDVGQFRYGRLRNRRSLCMHCVCDENQHGRIVRIRDLKTYLTDKAADTKRFRPLARMEPQHLSGPSYTRPIVNFEQRPYPFAMIPTGSFSPNVSQECWAARPPHEAIRSLDWFPRQRGRRCSARILRPVSV